MVKNRGQRCGDIDLVGYLANVEGPVPLVLDLRIAHDRFGSSSDPNLNGKLHWPNDIDKSLNESNADKIRKYRGDYNHNPPTDTVFIPAIVSSLVGSIVTGVFFHFRHTDFSSMLNSRVSSILDKTVVLRITLNLDGTPITSKSHTHPSYSQTSRLLTSSLSLGVQVPRPTQCMRDV